ncbi:MAG: hypothetical protein IJW29_02570 [Clostridia bacterium]|nr:hypothetical protein [Clostridia bacterium]
MKNRKHRLTLFLLITACLLVATPVRAHATEKRQTVFFGESTTAHLSRRGGVLDTPEGRGRVFRNESGTCMLSRRIMSTPIDLYEANGVKQTLPLTDALAQIQPARIVLSFGLNGIMGFIENKDAFLGAYRVLIDGVRKYSPKTEIILQSVYPVRASEAFSVDADTLNAHIRTLNGWICALAAEERIGYADTASLLCDRYGALRADYDCGDGIHLTNGAYEKILAYFSQKERITA